METAPVEPEASSAPTTGPGRRRQPCYLDLPPRLPHYLGLPEADIQRIAQAVATIYFEEIRGSVLQSSGFGTVECRELCTLTTSKLLLLNCSVVSCYIISAIMSFTPTADTPDNTEDNSTTSDQTGAQPPGTRWSFGRRRTTNQLLLPSLLR